ncbi:MAG TPA: hypothetical protein ENN69_02995 [Spirochaetia bacterium]|mgnify:CR=1 FL=1|nr:hypothetical protein [Spirochaetia bacterium]
MATRQEFYDNLKKQLDDLNSSADRIQHEVSSAASDVMEKGKVKLDKLREAQKAAQQKLNEIKTAGSDTWANLKQSAENGVNAVKHALSDIKSFFK